MICVTGKVNIKHLKDTLIQTGLGSQVLKIHFGLLRYLGGGLYFPLRVNF